MLTLVDQQGIIFINLTTNSDGSSWLGPTLTLEFIFFGFPAILKVFPAAKAMMLN